VAVTILSIGLLVFFGHFLADFFRRTKIPDVLILMLAGIALGPGTDVIDQADFGKVGPVFTTLALIIILFEGGVHLNVRHLRRAARDTLAISLGTFFLTVLLIAYVADVLLPIDFQTALLLGAILGGTSSAVVVPLIRVLKMGELPSVILFLESALTDVLVIVLSLGLLEALVVQSTAVSGFGLLLNIGASFLIAGLIGTLGAFLWSAILDRIRRVPNTVFTTIAYVFILYGTADLLGYSGAIAALAFGVAVANFPNFPEHVLGRVFSFQLNPLTDHEKAFFGEAVFLVKTFFFVYLGASMTFTRLTDFLVAAALVIVVFLARAPVVRLLTPRTTSRRDGALMGALVPKGLASAVLAGIPLQRGLATGDTILAVVYPTIFVSIVSCAALVFLIERGVLDGFMNAWFRNLKAEPTTEEHARDSLASFDALSVMKLSEFQEPNPIVELDQAQPQPPPTSDNKNHENDDDELNIERGEPL